MNAPHFSVLLPTHNRADVLPFAIGSVLAQTEADFELLIVADGCTDATAETVAGFDDPRIRFFDLPKAPYFGYANRNYALREACGRMIAYAAHDDLLLPDHLSTMGDLLNQTGASWGYSRPLWVSTDGVIVPFCTNLNLADEYRAFRETANTIPSPCVVHTRSALDLAGYWPEDVATAGDWVLWRRILGTGGGRPACQRQPTSLHFSANWRQSRHSQSEDVRLLLDIADQAAWWPSILRHPPASEPEQATLWRAMKSGGATWPAALRAAIDVVVDRIAWMTVRELQTTVAAAAAARSEAESALAAQTEAAVALAAADHRIAAAHARIGALETALNTIEQEHANALAAQSMAEASAGAANAEAMALRDAARRLGDVVEAQMRANAEMAATLEAAESFRALQPHLDAARAAQATAEIAAEAARLDCEALRSSTSWRLTAPLRRLGVAWKS